MEGDDRMRSLRILGRLARLIRGFRLGFLLESTRDFIDLLSIQFRKPLLKVKIDGLDLYGCLRHRSFLEHVASGTYEPYFRELFELSLRPGMIVVDGGAHIGLYSLLAQKTIGENIKILAFEPDPFNFFALKYNIEKNRCQNVLALPKALSNTVGIMTFWSSSGTIGSSLIMRKEIGKTKPISVPVTTLDEELPQPVSSILVKLDIEGHEPLALKGMERTLKRADVAVCMVEVNPHALKEAQLEPKDIIQLLQCLDFKIYVIDESNRKLLPLSEKTVLDFKCNLFCIRGEKVPFHCEVYER